MLANYCLTGFYNYSTFVPSTNVIHHFKIRSCHNEASSHFLLLCFDALDVFLSILFSLLKLQDVPRCFCQDTIFCRLPFSLFLQLFAQLTIAYGTICGSLYLTIYGTVEKKSKSFGYVGRERKKSMPKNPNALAENLIPILCQFFSSFFTSCRVHVNATLF